MLIDAVGGQGDGLAAGPVFVPYTLPGERVRAGVSKDRGVLIEVLTPSPDRVTPPCPHFGACGGCALQHWALESYAAWKVERIRLALARESIEAELLPAFVTRPESRRRLALHARAGSVDRALLGFKGRGSWNLVDIAVCPISDPRLQSALPGLRRLAAPLFEHPKSAPTLHVTWTDTGLDIEISGVERRTAPLSADARLRVAEAAQALDAARVTLGGEMLYGERQPVVRFGKAAVGLPPGAFLQAAPDAEAAMAGFVQAAVGEARAVVDLFCGVGTFALRLAEHAAVHAVDGDAAAIGALKAAAARAGLKPVTAEVQDLFRHPYPGAFLSRAEAVVFDPPRAGAADQAREIAASTLPLAVGVSCNPVTFARDARILIDAGFGLEQVLPVDQFLWSPHVELVGVFRR